MVEMATGAGVEQRHPKGGDPAKRLDEAEVLTRDRHFFPRSTV